MEIYNIVIQDPERVHDDYYYRSRKGKLMREMKSRFGDLLQTAKSERGEERFLSLKDSNEFTETVKKSLNHFTPWSTKCAIPEKIDSFEDTIEPLCFNGKDPDEEHRIEVNRIYAVLQPECYARLVGALGYDAPDMRLEIPEFAFNGNDTKPSGRKQRPLSLSKEELREIMVLLAEQSAARRNANMSVLRVMVDGVERARFDLQDKNTLQFELNDEAESIEICGAGKHGDVLLAAHLLTLDDLYLSESEQVNTIVLEGGQQISFGIKPTKDVNGEINGARCNLSFKETSFKRLAISKLAKLVEAFSNCWTNAGGFEPA
jgi:hypothetical protein